MKLRQLAIAATLALAPVVAHAQGFVEFGIGQTSVDLDELKALGFTDIDDSDTTFAISGGYMFTPLVGGEIGYRDLGEVGASVSAPGGTGSVKAEADGFFLGLLARIAVSERFSIVPRFGFYMWDSKVSGTANGVTVIDEDDDGTDPYFGIGAQFNVTRNVHVGANFLRYDLDGNDVDVIEARAGFSF